MSGGHKDKTQAVNVITSRPTGVVTSDNNTSENPRNNWISW